VQWLRHRVFHTAISDRTGSKTGADFRLQCVRHNCMKRRQSVFICGITAADTVQEFNTVCFNTQKCAKTRSHNNMQYRRRRFWFIRKLSFCVFSLFSSVAVCQLLDERQAEIQQYGNGSNYSTVNTMRLTC